MDSGQFDLTTIKNTKTYSVMNSISIYKAIKIKWLIINFDGYGFGEDNKLYNFKTGRQLKQVMNNRCIGYRFGNKFISLTKLRTMLYKAEKMYTPF